MGSNHGASLVDTHEGPRMPNLYGILPSMSVAEDHYEAFATAAEDPHRRPPWDDR